MASIAPTSSPTAADPVAAIRTQADALVKEKAADDFDKFLLLMTEQLRQQDPLNPTDATEFVAQLATFSSVEQSIKSNEKLDRLIATTTGLADTSATALIGKTVESATGQVAASGEPVAFSYEPVSDANRLVAQVRDAGDRLVREIPLDAGTSQALWDGRDSDGNPVTTGQQTIAVLQYADDRLLTSAPAVTASRVTEVRMQADGTRLVLANGAELTADEVRAIRAGE
ncbi:MAG: hypothetical protein KDC18_11490 [Alphaproteobacteria bacterium]|nr:hypothetical protein [Alphaproteobacteria bacterium]MCB9928753.1 hypothetical protein [Alphaproteobacteria bacterium]